MNADMKKPMTGEGEPAGQAALPASPAIILVEPQLPENIGAAARAMANFAVDDLRLVSPRTAWPDDKAIAAASGADFVVDKTRVYESVEQACSDLHFVYATTARPRDMIKRVLTPENAIAEILNRMQSGQQCGFLFGRERWGLENDHISLADAVVMAPVNPCFASINLAQAVLLICYEWRKQYAGHSIGRHTRFDGCQQEGLALQGGRPASKQEIYALFDHLERELDASGFLQPPEKRPTMVRNIRNMFGRMNATEQEVRTLRGIIASLCRAHRPRPK